MKPHCDKFELASDLTCLTCAKWIHPSAGLRCTYFCLDGLECETQGQRNRPEDALSGPVGINVARLLGIELPPVKEVDQ